jgi:hypothetical protein
MDKTTKPLVPQFLHLTAHILIDHPEQYGFDVLRQYLKLFPDQALAKLIHTYLTYLAVPLSDEEEKPLLTVSLDDVFKVITVRFLLLHPAARH